MGIELAFRAGYFVVALALIFYSRTLVTSTAILALAAWFAYGHPHGNSTAQEMLVFFIGWVSATAAAAVIGGTIKLEWMIELEWSLVTSARKRLRVDDAVRWLLACVVATLAYAGTEVVGYDRGTFYRLQSLALLLLLWMVIYFYDQVAANEGFHLLPPAAAHRHKTVTLVVAGAVLIDILARDVDFWRYLVPIGAAWLALQAFKLWLAPSLVWRGYMPRPNAKKSE